ncbi:hypothetical protein ACFLWO_04330 [Chloroflexota bacterium]
MKIERIAASASKKKAGNIIVSTGRGETGKSTFVALASRSRLDRCVIICANYIMV